MATLFLLSGNLYCSDYNVVRVKVMRYEVFLLQVSTLDPELLCPVSLEREQKELFMQVGGQQDHIYRL